MKVRLKPQWYLRTSPAAVMLTSEMQHMHMLEEQRPLLELLNVGLDVEDVSAAQFPQLEELNNQGLLTFIEHPDFALWELQDVSFKQAQEQFKHTTFEVLDATKRSFGREAVAAYLKRQLLSSGMVESTAPKLRLLLADSFLELPDSLGAPALPIVCNRLRISLGPLVLPWHRHVRDVTTGSEHYMASTAYSLPEAYDDLQKSWLATRVLKFVACSQLRFVNNIIEYNMITQETKTWPVQL